MHRLAIFGHEGANHLISKTMLVNDGITNVFCFYMFGITVAGYRDWHFAHHRLVGTDRDTELSFKHGWRYSQPKSRSAFFGMFLLDLVGGGADEVAKLAWASRPRSSRDALGLIGYWLVLLGFLQLTHQLLLAAIHVGLIFTTFWAIFRIRGWSEHVGAVGPGYTHRFSASTFAAYIFFPHNTWMHCEHHRFPTIPAHNLPLAREALGSDGVIELNSLFAAFASHGATSFSGKRAEG
jgi:fatty acid desaturase